VTWKGIWQMSIDPSIGTLTANSDTQSVLTLKAFDETIQSCLIPFRGVGHQAIIHRLAPRTLVVEMNIYVMKDSFGTGRVACAVTVHIYSISLSP